MQKQVLIPVTLFSQAHSIQVIYDMKRSYSKNMKTILRKVGMDKSLGYSLMVEQGDTLVDILSLMANDPRQARLLIRECGGQVIVMVQDAQELKNPEIIAPIVLKRKD